MECKNYNHPVPLEMVAKFKEVLKLNGISPSRGIFITTNTFAPRCTTIGIKTLDGKQLRRLERLAPLILLSKLCMISLCVYAFERVSVDFQRSKRQTIQEYLQSSDFSVERLPRIMALPPNVHNQLLSWKKKIVDYVRT